MRKRLSLNQQNLIVGIVQGKVGDAFALEAQRIAVQKKPIDLEPLFTDYNGNSLNTPLDKIILQPRWDTRTFVKLHFIRLWFPWQANKTKWQDFDSTLRELTIIKNPIYFLIIGNRKLIIHCLAVSPEDLMPMKNALKSKFADMEFTLMTNPFLEFNEAVEMVSKETHDWDFRDYYAGPAYWRRLTVDEHMQFSPIASVYSAISSLEEDELGFYQVVSKPTIYPWSDNILKLIETECEAIKYGGNVNFSGWYYPGFGDKENKNKVNSHILAVVIRIGAFTRKEKLSGAMESISLSFRNFQFAGSRLNYLDKSDYRGVIDNVSRLMKIIASGLVFHSGNLFNTSESASLFHFPTEEILKNDVYRIDRLKGFKVPESLQQDDGVVIGYNDYAGKRTVIQQPERVRKRHTAIIGLIDKGKSVEMANMALDDIRKGRGVGVIDRHGTVIERIIREIGEEYVPKTLYFSLLDKEYVPCYSTCIGKDIYKVVDDNVNRFKNLYPANAWGHGIEDMLRHCFYAIVSAGLPLAAIRILLSPNSEGENLRVYILPFLKNKEEELFWTENFRHLPVERVSSKFTLFLQPEMTRRAFSQKESKFAFRDIIDNKRIFLADLKAGVIGNDLADVMGSSLFSSFFDAAMSRMDLINDDSLDSEIGTPFNLYIDEFYRYPAKSLEHSLRELRKFNLRLIIALQQKQYMSEDLKSAMSNIGTWIVLASGWEDAQAFFREFYGEVEPSEFMRRATGDGFVKCAEDITNLKTYAQVKLKGKGFRDEIIRYSHEHYYTRVNQDDCLIVKNIKNKKKERAVYDEI